jgi:hypothetical protein
MWVGGYMSGIDVVEMVDMWLGELTSVSASFYAAAVYLFVVREGKVFSEGLGSSVMSSFSCMSRSTSFLGCMSSGAFILCANCRGNVLEQDLNSGSKEASFQSATLLVNGKVPLKHGTNTSPYHSAHISKHLCYSPNVQECSHPNIVFELEFRNDVCCISYLLAWSLKFFVLQGDDLSQSLSFQQDSSDSLLQYQTKPYQEHTECTY